MIKLIQELNTMLGQNKFDEIDQLFVNFNEKESSPEICITMLRGTFPARTLLKKWDQLLERIQKEFDNRGLDTKRLLQGLLKA